MSSRALVERQEHVPRSSTASVEVVVAGGGGELVGGGEVRGDVAASRAASVEVVVCVDCREGQSEPHPQPRLDPARRIGHLHQPVRAPLRKVVLSILLRAGRVRHRHHRRRRLLPRRGEPAERVGLCAAALRAPRLKRKPPSPIPPEYRIQCGFSPVSGAVLPRLTRDHPSIKLIIMD